MRAIYAALLGLALVSGCASTEAGAFRKVRMPLWGVSSGGGSFSGTLAAGVPLTLTGATSGTTGLSAAAVTTNSVNYSMPSGDGNAFSVLTTNGSHVLNWQTFQAGTGITLTRSGNTTTIASTGGGGGGGGGGSTALNPTTSLVSIGNALDTDGAGSNLPQFKFGTTFVADDGDPTMVGPSNDKFTICSSGTKELQFCLGTTFAGPYIDLRTNGIRVYGGQPVALQAGVYLQVSGDTTGSGSAALGANCPAVTATAPYTWVRMLSSDGSTVYVPAYK